MERCYPAKPEYATAKIAVWWDIHDCRIPEGYDVSRVRPNLEGAFKRLGYTGPVSITAYGELKQTPDHVLLGLVSAGVTVAHSAPGNICSFMFSDILEWRAHNPLPATMMLISNRVEDVLSWDLARLQQKTYYNLVRAYSVSPVATSVLLSSAEWFWDSLLESQDNETPSALVTAMFYCKLCSLDCQTLQTLRKHLSSRKHILKEARYSGDRELDPVTRLWGGNCEAETKYAKAKIGVWWNMDHCPIPKGYDARRIRPSLEGAFTSLGYTGPVSIIAFGDQKLTPGHVLEGLSSTGIDVAHSIPEETTGIMFDDMMKWQSANPPPATMMLISDRVEELYSHGLVKLQQMEKYNLFLAYPIRPYKMSVLVTSAEWLWDTLLAGLCFSCFSFPTVSETSGESGKSTGMFYCKLCYCDCKGKLCYCDCKGLEHFRKHLTSKVHSQRELSTLEDIQYCEDEQELLREMQTFKDFPETDSDSDSATESGALVVKGKGALQPSGPGASSSMGSSSQGTSSSNPNDKENQWKDDLQELLREMQTFEESKGKGPRRARKRGREVDDDDLEEFISF